MGDMGRSKKKVKTGKKATKLVKAVLRAKSVLQERKVDPKEWKDRLKALDAWPNLKVRDWRPILEELTRKEVHHKGALYKKCHKFVQNAKGRL